MSIKIKYFRVLIMALVASLSAFGVTLMVMPEAQACRMNHVDIFSQVDQARTIAVGTVDREEKIRVEERIRGQGGDVLSVADWAQDGAPRTSCVPQIAEGRRILVFLDGSQSFVAHYQSALSLGSRADEGQAKVEGVKRYAGASDDAERLDILMELASGSDVKLAREAARHLIDRVEWFEQISEDQREALRTGFAGHDEPIFEIGWLLARLGDEQARGAMEGFLGRTPRASRDRVGLELLEHRHDDEIEGREELAAIIEDDESEPMERVAALERCERELGKSLFSFERYQRGIEHRGSRLAESCRSGEPQRY